MKFEDLEKEAAETRKAWNVRRTKLRRSAKCGGVRVTMNGHLRVVGVKLENEVLDDIPALESAVCTAVNRATDSARKAREKVEGKPSFGPMMEYMFDLF